MLFPLVVVAALALLISSSGKKPAPEPAPGLPVPPAPPPPKTTPRKTTTQTYKLMPGETWGILARTLKPMSDDDWTNFASNLGGALGAVGATMKDFKIGSDGSFAYSITPTVEFPLTVPQRSTEFEITRAERLSGAPSV